MSFWGQVAPNWLEAAGTMSASGTALYLAWKERQRAVIAESERDALREAATAGPASRVAAWMQPTPDPPGARRIPFSDRRESWRVMVKNASDQVVQNVKGYIVHADGVRVELVGEWSLVPPMETVHEDREMLVEQYNEKPYVRLTFEDPAGRRWARGQDGRLRIATEDDDRIGDY